MESHHVNWSYPAPQNEHVSEDFVNIPNFPDNMATSSSHGYYTYYQPNTATSSDLSQDNFFSPNGLDDPFADEPPLLEELGINFDQIMQKTLAAIIPYKKSDQANENSFTNEHNHAQHNEQRSTSQTPIIQSQSQQQQQQQPQQQPQQQQSSLNKNFVQSLKTPPPLKYFGDLLTEKEDSATRSSNSNIISNDTNLDSNNLSSSSNYVDERSLSSIYQEFGQCGQSPNSPCDSLISPNNNNNSLGGSDESSLNRSSSSDTQEDGQLFNISWDKSISDELTYPYDSRVWPRFVNSNLNHPPNVNTSSHTISKPASTGQHKYIPARPSLTYGQRPILPSPQPPQTTTHAYPYQRPVPIQPNLGYSHRVSSRFISPYVQGRDIILWRSPNRMYTPQAPPGTHHQTHMASLSSFSDLGSVHNRVLNSIMIPASRVAFTNSVDDSSSPSSSCSTSSTPSPGLIDKKLFVNNPVLVNMLTCPQYPGLRNLAPAPDSSSSHFDEKSKNDILSGLIDVSGEKRKRSIRAIPTTSREPIKREIRPKIFDIEQFKIGLFSVQSSNDGSRRNSSTQLKVIFSKKRFIYEFAYSGSYNSCYKNISQNISSVQSHQSTTVNRNSSTLSNGTIITNNNNSNPVSVQQNNSNAPPVVYYVIAVPFDNITGLNIDESTMYLTVNQVPCLFGGTSVRSKVLFEKAPRFDPSQGELENNALHSISLKPTQVGRLRTSLVDFDKKFADLLSTKIDRDPYSYRCKLPELGKEKEEESTKVNQVINQSDSAQVLKKPKLNDKIDYQDVDSPSSQNNSGLLDIS